jgi:hypothetical protein
MNPTEKAVIQNSNDLLTGLLVADLRVILKDERAKNPAWVIAMFRKVLKAVNGI